MDESQLKQKAKLMQRVIFSVALFLTVGGLQAEEVGSDDLIVLKKILTADNGVERAAAAGKLGAAELKAKVVAALPEIEAAAVRWRRTQQLMKDVADVGGKTTLAAGGPDWLRKAAGDEALEIFSSVVSVDLYDGNNPLKGKGGVNSRVNDAWLAKLAGCDTIASLNLANCDVHGAGLQQVATITKLETLNLTLTPVLDEDLSHLRGLTELKSLSLASTKCTGTGFQHLRELRKLSNLNMHFTPANDAGLAAIAQAGDLERLWVVHAKFTDAVAPSFAAHKNLRRLGCGSSDRTSSGKALAQIGKLQLAELELFDQQATDEAVAYAAEISTLRLLNIAHGPTVTDAALDKIAAMPALEELKIASSKITDVGLLKLVNLKSLRKLTLSPSKTITDAALARLRAERTDLTIEVK